jgi:hypothetical protein
MKKMGTLTIGAAAAALLAGSVFTAPASAAPAASVAATQGVSQAATSNVEQVRSRRGWRGHRHRHSRGWGWGAGAVGAGLLLTAPLWAGGYDDGYYDDGYDGAYAYGGGGGYARCEATFKSFDPESGTYMGYDGIRRTCPYL